MAFQSVINPHNVVYGSTTLTGVTAITYAPISIPPQPVIADDSSVAIHRRSSHVGHTGTITMADPTSADALAAQAGPDTLSFDGEESDSNTDMSYSFAGVEFSEPTEALGTGQPANCTLTWAGKALSRT